MIDNQHIYGAGSRFQFEPELLLQSLEERGSVRVRLGICAGRQSFSNLALGNAIFEATGVRVRSVPFKPERIKAVLAGS